MDYEKIRRFRYSHGEVRGIADDHWLVYCHLCSGKKRSLVRCSSKREAMDAWREHCGSNHHADRVRRRAEWNAFLKSPEGVEQQKLLADIFGRR